MTTTITDELMISDQTRHTALWTPGAGTYGEGAWIVSWLPDRPLTHDQAVTAMTLADEVATHAVVAQRHVAVWARELGLTAQQAADLLAAVA